MTRDPLTDQLTADDEVIDDELTDQDREAAKEAKTAMAFLAGQPSLIPSDKGLVPPPLPPEAPSAAAFQPGLPECSFSLPAACLVAGMAAVHLPPSDLSKFLKRHDKPLTQALYPICLTVDAAGLRLTNHKLGVACEVILPLASFAASGAASHSFYVSLAHLEGLFPDRPYRHGNRLTDKVDWAKMPDAELAYSRPKRQLTVRVGESFWDLPAEPCDSPKALPVIPEEEPAHHGLIARLLEKAIRYAGTFSSFGRKDPMCGMISIADGAACGGFAGAATRFESKMMDGFTFDISAEDAAAVRSVLLRLQAFRMMTDGDRLLISDHGMRVSIDLAKRNFYDLAAPIRTIEANGVAVTVPLHKLHHAAQVAAMLQLQETDRQPVYLDAMLGEEDDKKLLTVKGITPAGHHSWVSVDILGRCEPRATGEILWTARSAHLKRAATPTDCNETVKVIANDRAVLLVLEREGGILTHILLIPKVDRPKPAPVDDVAVELDSEPAKDCPEREIRVEPEGERPAAAVEA
jgi:hypothetical protein